MGCVKLTIFNLIDSRTGRDTVTGFYQREFLTRIYYTQTPRLTIQEKKSGQKQDTFIHESQDLEQRRLNFGV